jgi:hypothetical protein
VIDDEQIEVEWSDRFRKDGRENDLVIAAPADTSRYGLASL